MFQLIERLVRRVIQFWRNRVGLRLRSRLTTIRIGGLGLAAIALWLFAELAEEVMQNESRALDTTVLLTIQKFQEPWLDPIMVLITDIGDPTVLVVFCGVVSLWLLRRREKSEAMTIAIAALGALVLNTLLKRLFERQRPALWSRIVDVRYYSFPSGHAMLSIVIYGLLGYLLARRFPCWRGQILAGSAIAVFLIGFSRLYLGVHWLTDIIAGYLAGLVWLIACIFSLEIWQHRRELGSLESND